MTKNEFTAKFENLKRDDKGYYYGIDELLAEVKNFISCDSSFSNVDYNVIIVVDDGFLELSNVRQNYYYSFLRDIRIL